MKLTYWSFNQIFIPMLEDDERNLFCTSAVLCRALGITEAMMRDIRRNHPHRFSSLSVGNSHAKEFINDHMATLGVKRVRDDMHLWTESDMITFAMLSNSDVAIEFQNNIIQLVKDNARRGYVSREEYDALETRLMGELAKIKEIYRSSQPSVVKVLKGN